jgi:hypothetical protein
MNGPDSLHLTDDEADHWLDYGTEEERQKLALNPQCPICHLHALSHEYPRLILMNPVLQTLMIENIEGWHSLLDDISFGLYLDYIEKKKGSTSK